MFANLFLAIFCVGTILLYGKVRKQSRRIRRIEETSIEPDKRIDEHEKKIIALGETQEKGNKEMLNLTKRITTLENTVKI